MKKLLLLIFFTSLLFSEVKISLSHQNIKHGTTFAVVLQSEKKLTQAPNLIYKNKTYQMFTINGSTKNYEVFIPVDYYSKKQKEKVVVNYKDDGQLVKKSLDINIVDGNYKQNEIIKVAKGKVTLSKKNKTRSKDEYNQVFKNVYSKVTLYDLTNQNEFIYPMSSKITSNFGNARVYNGKTKSYHTGTDFRAKVGTNIYSANDGVVALVMDRFYLGLVVYIDHGRGAYTYYSHLNSTKLKKGQKIKKGDLIGLSGKSGRVTGPHLHYAVRLYNTTVDPIQYGNLYNQILKKYH